MRRYFSTAIAIGVGVIVLLGYFLQDSSVGDLRLLFLQSAVFLSAAAILVGVLNLFFVHFNKISQKSEDRVNSLFLLTALFFSVIFGFMYKPTDPIMVKLFNAVILPVETSLMAILSITLIYAAIRLLRRRADLMTIIFLTTALFIMLSAALFPFDRVSFVAEVRPWIIRTLSASGARGILIGVGLGTLLTGLRVLLGFDRPYGGR